ncbi:CoA-binding protein [Croceivirga thetidis]|uniref:CoA-binding protein n=1 Tax=Croceivirga thetidis TaxID=2721623 RepID=A0ABX1GU42_9FLAO|nr:CoA-binding protein [Croceivirga thetidis]NKI33467.1 CoA-binding protein [Croceivirga thetidis]
MCKTLVFGASLKSNRYSNLAVNRLVENGFETQAFGIKPGTISTIKVTENLGEIANIDIVTLYMRSELQKKYYKEIVGLQPQTVIFNPGTENVEFYDILRENNIEVLVACTLVLLSTRQYGCK